MPTFRSAVIVALTIVGVAPVSASAKSVYRHGMHVAHRTQGPAYASRRPYRFATPYAGRHSDALRYPPGYGPTSADPYASYVDENPYSPYAAAGAAIRALAHRNQYAPGVTNELAPDNIATATGGPSGGVPSFSAR